MTFISARKGDLILVETVHRDYVIGQGARVSTEYQFGVVASATRDGMVKTWAAVGWGDDLVSTDFRGRWVGQDIARAARYWVVPKADVDVDGVLAAAKAHHWPGTPGQPKEYDSLDEARAVAKQHRRESAGVVTA